MNIPIMSSCNIVMPLYSIIFHLVFLLALRPQLILYLKSSGPLQCFSIAVPQYLQLYLLLPSHFNSICQIQSLFQLFSTTLLFASSYQSAIAAHSHHFLDKHLIIKYSLPLSFKLFCLAIYFINSVITDIINFENCVYVCQSNEKRLNVLNI